MEHIIQFGITVDDDAIKKRIIEQASNTVITEVKRELGVDTRYYRDSQIRELVDRTVNDWFYENKDIIIQETAKLLADKLIRTKAVKEATSKVIEDVLNN